MISPRYLFPSWYKGSRCIRIRIEHFQILISEEQVPKLRHIFEILTREVPYSNIQCTDKLPLQIHLYINIIRVFCQRAGPSLQAQEPRLQFCRRQVFHRKFRNHSWSFTRDWMDAVASRCFPHPTISLASEQTLKDPRGTNLQVRKLDMGNWQWRVVHFYTG